MCGLFALVPQASKKPLGQANISGSLRQPLYLSRRDLEDLLRGVPCKTLLVELLHKVVRLHFRVEVDEGIAPVALGPEVDGQVKEIEG